MCPEPTEFLLIGYLTELTWKVRFRSSALTPPDCRHIDKRKLLMWRMEQSSLFFQHQPFQRPLLCQENFSLLAAPKRCRKGCKNRWKKTGLWRNPGQLAMNLTSSVPASSSSVNSPIASTSPGILKASSRQVGLSGKLGASANQISNPDAASSSQGWQRDAPLFLRTGRLVATDNDQGFLDRHEKSVISTGELVATEYQRCSENLEFGHIISKYHHIKLITWRESSRS